MNNIELVEEVINEAKKYNQYDGNKYYKAMENLIKENKELKEELEYTKKQIPQDKIFYYSEKDYISKSKVKEKIEWYEEACKHLSKNGIDLDKYDQYQGAIEALQELLEEVIF